MKYEFIESYVGEYAVVLMCCALGVSPSGYYKWLDRSLSERAKRRSRFEQLVMCTFAEYRARYGSVRLAEELNKAGYACSVNYIADIMAKKGIKARNGKGFKYSKDVAAMTNVADNLLRRDFEAESPNQKWVTDITYIWGVNYIADIMAKKGIKARNGKGFKYSKDVAAMTNVADNLLRRDFEAESPNQKWVTDITYIWVKSRWLYLATVLDL
ncbi:hypothetical protein L4C39_20170, partial [Vibrio clamense]